MPNIYIVMCDRYGDGNEVSIAAYTDAEQAETHARLGNQHVKDHWPADPADVAEEDVVTEPSPPPPDHTETDATLQALHTRQEGCVFGGAESRECERRIQQLLRLRHQAEEDWLAARAAHWRRSVRNRESARDRNVRETTEARNKYRNPYGPPSCGSWYAPSFRVDDCPLVRHLDEYQETREGD